MIKDQDYFIVDNWYKNPYEIRKIALNQLKFEKIDPRIPGIRSQYTPYNLLKFNKLKFETVLPKSIDETYWLHFSAIDINSIIDEITFQNPILIESTPISSTGVEVDNGRFHLISEDSKSWGIHKDTTNWAAVIYLTPDAPKNSGTSFFTENHNLIFEVENIFNRCIIYKSKIPHRSTSYFGNTLEDSRLTQVFFFNLKE